MTDDSHHKHRIIYTANDVSLRSFVALLIRARALTHAR